jgi:thiol-disulfide isomerase/thioredoxin
MTGKPCFRSLLLIYMAVTGLHVAAQGRHFVLSGTIALDSGTVSLVPVGDPLYYPDGTGPLQAVIHNGRFTFKGSILYPYAFRLLTASPVDYISDIFFVAPGQQFIVCHKDSIREIPGISNGPMLEYRNTFIPQYLSVSEKYPDYNQRLAARAEMIYHYVCADPDSYIGLWEIVSQLKRGYSKYLDSSFRKLSAGIRATVTGKRLSGQLLAAWETAIGNPFPKLRVEDSANHQSVVPARGPAKYTLVDFWFSSCHPCLSQFPLYKSIYSKYKGHGFELIGISVDSQAHIADWKRVLRDEGTGWPNFIDMGGKLASQLAITVFPTNFLLDSTSHIAKRDLSPQELIDFLSGALMK